MSKRDRRYRRREKRRKKMEKQRLKAEKKWQKVEAKEEKKRRKQLEKEEKKRRKLEDKARKRKRKGSGKPQPSGKQPSAKGSAKSISKKEKERRLSVQKTISYREMGKDGICRVKDKLYSKCIRFYDINYQLAQNEDKNAIFENWCDFLNYFDSTVQFQLSFINHKSCLLYTSPSPRDRG